MIHGELECTTVFSSSSFASYSLYELLDMIQQRNYEKLEKRKIQL